MSTSKIQRIICGNNLDVLKSIADESVDEIYIDPPFFTNKKYEIIWNDGAEIRQFNDRWFTDKKSSDAKPTRSSKDINYYLEWMEIRIKEHHRILKKTGSFYLHCDYHADGYLRVLCDKIFEGHLINIIHWKRATAKNSAEKKYDETADTIFIYSKSDIYTFNKQYGGRIEKSLAEYKEDENGWYKWQDLTAPSSKPSFEWRGITPSQGRTWAYPIEKLEEFNSCGLIRFKDGKPMMRGLKKYVKEIPNQSIGTIWDDIVPIVGGAKERLGYPTQKPEALLVRIIQTSSNEGDVILDSFCGCGTSIAVAKKLKRQFIGIDVSPTACRLIAKRIGFRFDCIEGLPITSEEITQLDGNEFQNFIIREFGGFSGARGSDGGIDGYLGECPIQVKKNKAGRAQLDAFSGTLLREKKKEAIFIALDYSVDFREEAARLKRENEIIIYYYDIPDILAKRHYPIVNKFIQKHGLEKYQTKNEENR